MERGNSNPVERQIKVYEHELQKYESVYTKAKKELLSQEFRERQTSLVAELMETLMFFGPDDNPTKAVYLIGRCQELIRQVQPMYQTIREYEEKKRRLDRLREST